MTVIVLTPEQEAVVQEACRLKYEKIIADNEAKAAKALAALQRRTDDRILRANQRTADWKLSFATTRKQLIEANTEIATLKRKLRNGEWND